jgi:hypothetical protein
VNDGVGVDAVDREEHAAQARRRIARNEIALRPPEMASPTDP